MRRPLTEDLTPQQGQAVTHRAGPMLVLAGAGAGKTRVLCNRLAWLVNEGADPVDVLALTFSAKAAAELRERAEAMIPGSHETLRVTTFHSYALDLVRTLGTDRDLAPVLQPAGTEERVLVLLDRLVDLELSDRASDLRTNPVQVVRGFIDRIDRCRDERVDPRRYASWAQAALDGARSSRDAADARREVEFARVFRLHDEWLAELGMEDFGRQITRAMDLLAEHADLLDIARSRTRHVLVDEFQDTNHAQAELLYLVSQRSDSLVVVGDDDQGIYRFRGASAKNMADFRMRFPDAPVVRLEMNHRSTQAILDAAHAVVEPIAAREAKVLRALPGAEGPPPEFWRAPDPAGQARAVAAEILRLAEQGTPYEEMAVLMKAVRTEGRVIVAELEQAGIPHQVHGGTDLFDRREVRLALAWMRAATDPTDAIAHLRVATDPSLGLPWAPAAQAVSEAAAAGTHITGPLGDLAGSPAARALLDDLGRTAAVAAPLDLVREVLDRTGIRVRALALGGAEGAARLADLASLERLAHEVVAANPGMDAPALVRHLDGLAGVGFRASGGTPERLGVQVMTIHQSKGLEFDAVWVLGLTRFNFPGRDRARTDIPDALLPEALPRGKDAHVAEQRRLAYVAMTRARRHLYLCTFTAGDTGIPQHPSPFAEEARSALGDPPWADVGAAPDRAVLDALATARARLEDAVNRAAEGAAGGGDDALALADAAADAARALVVARADVLAGPAPAEPPTPEPRAPRPGLQLSPTDVARYLSCPLAYRFASVDRVPARWDPNRAIGNSIHAALEACFRDGVPEDGADRVIARFAAEMKGRGAADTAVGRQALDRVREHIPRYLERVRKSGVRPVGVERAFSLGVGPHIIHGRIDRIDAHPQGGHQLVDYKSGRAPARETEAGRLVLITYIEGARDAWGIEPRGATLEYVLDGEVRNVHPDGVERAEAMERVRDVADSISAGRFDPAPGWACRTCDFNMICPAQDR
jgi:DNA helicase-2/ATP-dependent DNA helicase PcrA